MVSPLQADNLGLAVVVVVVYLNTGTTVQRLGLQKTLGSEDSLSHDEQQTQQTHWLFEYSHKRLSLMFTYGTLRQRSVHTMPATKKPKPDNIK